MSKTFKEWLEIGGKQDHYGEYDMEESWDAACKATERRVLDEVIEIFNDGCMPCYGMARNYKAIDTIEFLKELKQKYGVKL